MIKVVDKEKELLMKDAELLFKNLTEEEQKFFEEDNVVRDVQQRIFKFINNYIRKKDSLIQKYKMIQDIINNLRGNQCPQCGSGFGVRPKKILDNYKCFNGHEYGHHEIPSAYLWRIMDIIDEKVEEL